MPVTQNPDPRERRGSTTTDRDRDKDKNVRDDEKEKRGDSKPRTSEHYYVFERVGTNVEFVEQYDDADDASNDVVNRRKVGGQRNFFVLNVHHVNTADDDDCENDG